MAADLVRQKVDVIVASSQAPALAAQRSTTTIPIVMINATEPVRAGLVASLARPGVTSPASASSSPRRSRASSSGSSRNAAQARARRRAAQPRHDGGPGRIRSRRAGPRAAGPVPRGEGPAISGPRLRRWFVVGVDALLRRVTPSCSRSGSASPSSPATPAAGHYCRWEFPESGGLMSYSARLTVQFRRAAVYVDRFSAAPAPPPCPWSRPASASWSSTSRPEGARAHHPVGPPRSRRRADPVSRAMPLMNRRAFIGSLALGAVTVSRATSSPSCTQGPTDRNP